MRRIPATTLDAFYSYLTGIEPVGEAIRMDYDAVQEDVGYASRGAVAHGLRRLIRNGYISRHAHGIYVVNVHYEDYKRRLECYDRYW